MWVVRCECTLHLIYILMVVVTFSCIAVTSVLSRVCEYMYLLPCRLLGECRTVGCLVVWLRARRHFRSNEANSKRSLGNRIESSLCSGLPPSFFSSSVSAVTSPELAHCGESMWAWPQVWSLRATIVLSVLSLGLRAGRPMGCQSLCS